MALPIFLIPSFQGFSAILLVFYAVFLFIFGLLFPGVDNYAHAGGFVGGYALAKWLDPMKPERGDHLLMAVVCLAATAVSILASVVYGLPILESMR